jgi:hypothetical protein
MSVVKEQESGSQMLWPGRGDNQRRGKASFGHRQAIPDGGAGYFAEYPVMNR